MILCKTKTEIRTFVAQWKAAGECVAFVPTMGALHEGHLSLVRLAARNAQKVVVSIFVNPTQFAPNEDFSRYPRTEEADLALCREEGVAAVFCPGVDEMYLQDASVSVAESRLSQGLCGATRPGHFSGVMTVVLKLFNIVQPDIAVFGQKDAQQVAIIERMVRDLDIPVRIIRVPIYREPDGLAMSSRNRYLNADERQRALCLSRALDYVHDAYSAGNADVMACANAMRGRIEVAGGIVDYIAFVDAETLTPVPALRPGTLVALAVKIGTTRLIDNTEIR